MVAALACDLRKEVLPNCEGFVHKIMPLIQTRSPEIVEAASTALAYLFKYHSDSLVSDLRPTFNLIAPLLGSQKQKSSVRRIAAETLSFLVRKLKGTALQQFVAHTIHAMLECLPEQMAAFREGIALLYFEAVHSTKLHFYSSASGVLTVLLRELYKEEISGLSLEDNDVYALVATVFKLCLHHASRSTAAETLWQILFDQYDTLARAVMDNQADRIQPLLFAQGLLALGTVIRKGDRVSEYKPLFQRCLTSFELLQSQAFQDICDQENNLLQMFSHERLRWLSGLLVQSEVTDLLSSGRTLLDMAFFHESSTHLMSMALSLARLEWKQWNQIMLPYMVRMTISKWEDAAERNCLLWFWTQIFQTTGLINTQQDKTTMSTMVTSRGQVVFPPSDTTNVSTSLIEWLSEPVDYVDIGNAEMAIPDSRKQGFEGFDEDKEGIDGNMSELATKTAILTMLARVSVEPKSLYEGLCTFVQQITKAIRTLTQKLCAESSYLEHISNSPDNRMSMGPVDGDTWGDEANELLGLYQDKSARLYWGQFKQVHPLLNLLGQALGLLADTVSHLGKSVNSVQVMEVWNHMVDEIIPVHHTNHMFIEGLVKLADTLKFIASITSIQGQLDTALSVQRLEQLVLYVEDNLMSFQPQLRLQTLRLLALFEQPAQEDTKSGKSQQPCDAVQQGIELESIPAKLDTYKEKTNPLRRMAIHAANGRIPKIYSKVFPYLAIAQFSVNFSLLWTEVGKQLALLAGKNSELLWSAIWRLLRRFNDERLLIETGLTPEAKGWISTRQLEQEALGKLQPTPKLEGYLMNCPYLVQFGRIFDAMFAQKDRDSMEDIDMQALMIARDVDSDTDRIDYNNVYKQLIKLLAENGATAAAIESHSEPIVKTFIGFVKYDLGWMALLLHKKGEAKLGLDVDLDGFYNDTHRGLLVSRSRRMADALTTQWLTLFSKFRNQRSLYLSDHLYTLFMRLLARGDTSIQRKALDCILARKDGAISPYADNLRNLVDDKRFRDELKTFNLAVDGEGSISAIHRDKCLPIVFRLLHGQMVARHGKSSRKEGMRIKRMAIFNAMVGITPDELRSFVFVGLDSFDDVIAAAAAASIENAEHFSLMVSQNDQMDVDNESIGFSDSGETKGAIDAMERVSHKAQLSYFHLMTDMIRILGFKAAPVFHESLVILLSSIGCAQRQIGMASDELEELAAAGKTDYKEEDDESEHDSDDEQEERDDEDDALVPENNNRSSVKAIRHRRNIARNVRQMAVKCLAKMFELQPPQFEFAPYVPCIYEVAADPRIDNLAYENSQNSSALLLLFRSWSLTPKYFSYLVSYNPLTFQMLLSLLVAPSAQPKVIALVLDILQTFLDYSSDQAMEQFMLAEEEASECTDLVNKTIQDHVSLILSHMCTCFSDNKLLQMASGGPKKQQRPDNSNNSQKEGECKVDTKKTSSQALRQIQILSRVADYVDKQAQDAKVLLDLLLPVLKRPNRAVPEHNKNDILLIMLQFIPLVLNARDVISDEDKQTLFNTYFEATSSAFGRIRLDSARMTLGQILAALADVNSSTCLKNAATLIGDINSCSSTISGGPDFDRRLAAYAQLNEEMWDKPDLIDAQAWVPILYNLKYYAQDHEELSIRSNSAFGIARFIKLVAKTYQTLGADDPSTIALSRGLTTIILPAVKHAFTSIHEPVRLEFVGIWRRAIRECGEYIPQLADLTKLDNHHEEANFFYNIGHIQLHRRQRALRRFRNLVVGEVEEKQNDQMEIDKDDEEDGGSSSSDSDEDVEEETVATKRDNDRQAIPKLNLNELTSEQKPPVIPIAILRDYFIPLFEHWVLDETGAVHHELANEAVLTIGAMGAALPWTQYCSALRKYLSMMQKSPALERRLTRLILALMDKFHFDLRQVQVDSQGRLISRATDEEDTEMVDNDERMKVLEAEQIHETIVHKLLPQLKAKIRDNDDKTIALKVPVSMAVVRILTAMPTQTMNTQLPGILTTICNMLRSKAQPVRNVTRKTLVRISKFLGPKYFGFLVSELSSSLSRGPQIHVLGYTIFVLIKEMMRQLQVGDLDYVIEPLVEILVKDTFGEAGDEKDDDEWVTKLKEAKVHHGPDCFEMLASVLSFDHVRLMLAPLRDILRETDTPKRTKKIEGVMHRISAGLNRNRSYNTREVLIFSQGIISQYLELSATTSKQTEEYLKAVERQKRLRATGEDEVTVHMTRNGARPKRDYLQANAHIFVHFGLETVHHGLRRNRFDINDVEVLGLLDPFAGLAADGLDSRYNSIIAQCCKIWTLLARLPLPSVPAKISLIVERLFVLFRQSSNTNSEMIQSCFKLLASLLRSINADKLMEGYKLERIPEPEDKNGRSSLKSIRKPTKEAKPDDGNKDEDNKCKLLSGAQLRDLIDFIRPDLEDPEHQATAFSLIRAILHRRLAVDTLYTLLDYIRELMVTAQTPHMRETCRLTWFQFLMDYPMGERRLTNAMTFIIQNASGYVFESGRMSALEIMSVIVDRFADDVLLAKCAESFFLGLVLIIAKDESAKCREMAAHLLPQLVVRFDQPRLQRVWILLDQWSAGIEASNKGSAKKKEEEGGDEAEEAQVKLAKMRELGRAALQCYGLLVEPLGDRFFKHESEFISTIDSALTVSWQTWKQAERQLNFENADTGNTTSRGELEAIAANLHQGGEDPEQAALLYWETAYTALTTYGKYVSAWPQKAMNDSNQSRIWLLAMHHLSHPHAWTKLASSRLIGLYVSNADPAWMLEAEKEEGEPIDDDFTVNPKATAKYVLLSQKRLQDLTHALLLQLNSRYLAADLGNQIVKNLYFVAKCFLTATMSSSDVETNQEGEDDDGEEEGETTTKNGNNLQQLPVERTLSWLINRVGRLARTEIIRGRGSTRRRTYCFRWFAAVIMLVPPELLQQSSYIMAIASPLHRTTEDDQLPSRPITLPNGTNKTPEEQLDELKSLAREVIKLAQDRIGVTAFSAVLNKIQKHVDVLRSQRREQRKQLAISDPQKHIQEKQRKHEVSRRKRQEKSNELARKKIRTVVRRAQK